MHAMGDFLAKLKGALTPLPRITDDDPAHQYILAEAGRQAEQELDDAGVPRQIGWTETFLATKQAILREKYGVRWRPPRQ